MDFKDKSYDVFRMFNDRWALVTPVTVEHGVVFGRRS